MPARSRAQATHLAMMRSPLRLMSAAETPAQCLWAMEIVEVVGVAEIAGGQGRFIFGSWPLLILVANSCLRCGFTYPLEEGPNPL
jgi:hypothetical protein